jgi:D-aspartate ligase
MESGGGRCYVRLVPTGPRPPVLVLAPPRFIGPLGVMRSLRALGARVYGLAHDDLSIAGSSRFCAGTFAVGRNGRPVGSSESTILEQLCDAGRRLGAEAVLVAGSDEWSVFVARHAAALAEYFRFPATSLELTETLASKSGLHDLARRHGVPTPRIAVPRGETELLEIGKTLRFPVMLKPIVSRPGSQGLELAETEAQLSPLYASLNDPGNIACQEYIPGTDLDVWIFNGYFDHRSRCLAAFTGQKIHQHPARMGLCVLGVSVENREVIALTERFLGRLGYHGIVDIGYRWDRRDGCYKVLDINPRLGGAFRMFVDANGMDVARAMYLDMIGEPVPAVVPQNGRKWVLEAGEILSFRHYRRDGMSWRDWLAAMRGVKEGATFAWRDPGPFITAMCIVVGDSLAARLRRHRPGWTARLARRWRSARQGA